MVDSVHQLSYVDQLLHYIETVLDLIHDPVPQDLNQNSVDELKASFKVIVQEF